MIFFFFFLNSLCGGRQKRLASELNIDFSLRLTVASQLCASLPAAPPLCCAVLAGGRCSSSLDSILSASFFFFFFFVCVDSCDTVFYPPAFFFLQTLNVCVRLARSLFSKAQFPRVESLQDSSLGTSVSVLGPAGCKAHWRPLMEASDIKHIQI